MIEINCGDDNYRLAASILHYCLDLGDINRLSAAIGCRRNFKSKRINYSLPFGETKVNYKDKEIIIDYTKQGNPLEVNGNLKYHTNIIVKSNEATMDEIKEFLEKAKEYYSVEILERAKNEDKLTVHIFDDYWDELRKFPKRSIDTIYLKNNLAQDLLKDAKDFLSKETEEEYKKLGMPYKRNYLFHGHPGTGKTSLIYSLASELDLDVCIINFDVKTTDGMFMRAVTRMTEDCILVLEDIDVIFEKRENKKGSNTTLNFNSFLNVLDGFAHQDKLIIVMTTNYKCSLDGALTRACRIDKQIHFDYADEEQINQMFNIFLPNKKDKFDKFYNRIKTKKVTTAVLQNYLFNNRKQQDILTNIKDLIEDIDRSQYGDKALNMYM